MIRAQAVRPSVVSKRRKRRSSTPRSRLRKRRRSALSFWLTTATSPAHLVNRQRLLAEPRLIGRVDDLLQQPERGGAIGLDRHPHVGRAGASVRGERGLQARQQELRVVVREIVDDR